MSSSWRRPARWPAPVVGGLALLSVLVLALGGTGAGAPPPVPLPASYRPLYIGLDPASLALPPVLARNRLAVLEAAFPKPASAKASSSGRPAFYVGLTLGRLSCRNYYLARVSSLPGVLTLTVRQHRLAPGRACFELIGPDRYQVLALPRRLPYPGYSHLTVVVQRPGGSQEQSRLRLS
ncbi:MAG TPA: hypothetical protein VI138_05655 [Candidatus Dormibacteraeota bacterium]